MTEASAALCDFAIEIKVALDFSALAQVVRELLRRDASRPPSVELFGRPGCGQAWVLLRYPAAAQSPALRQKVAREAGRLRGALVEPLLLSAPERERLYAEKLARCEVKVEIGSQVDPAIEAFRERMGRSSAGARVEELRFRSGDEIAAAWARCVSQGSLFVPARQVPPEGSYVTLRLTAPEVGAFEASACALEADVNEANEPGFWALLSPSDALMRFLSRHSARALQGRKLGGDEPRRRQFPRFATCLEVVFEDHPELSGQYASNISRGGLFVRTENPPPLGSKVRLTLQLPDGSVARTEAEVVHRVDADEARERGGFAGVGIAFSPDDGALKERMEQMFVRFPERRPRVLVVDDDRFFREVLADALAEEKVDVEIAGGGIEALQILSQRFFAFDAVVLDLQMPDLDGRSLMDRLRRLGGALDLKIIVVAAGEQEELERLKGREGANEVIRKGTPLEEILRRLLAALSA